MLRSARQRLFASRAFVSGAPDNVRFVVRDVRLDPVEALRGFDCIISVYIFVDLLLLFDIVSYVKRLLLLELPLHLFSAF